MRDLTELQLCVCGHQAYKHSPGCEECNCLQYDSEREYWGDSGIAGWSFSIGTNDIELIQKFKKIKSYLQGRENQKKISRKITDSDVFLYCLKQYGGRKDDRKWII